MDCCQGAAPLTLRYVLLPGMDGTGALFQPFLDAMQTDANVIVASYPRDQSLSHVELLDHIRLAIPVGPYVLLAESFSGPLAVAHAATCPPDLKALVLCATFVSNPLHWALRWIKFLPTSFTFTFAPPRWIVRALLTGPDSPMDLVGSVIAAINTVEPSVMSHRLAQILDVDAAEKLATIDVPIMYLAGSGDRLVGLRGLAQVAKQRADLHSVTIEGPHLLLQARPGRAAREIVDFVAERVLDIDQRQSG